MSLATERPAKLGGKKVITSTPVERIKPAAPVKRPISHVESAQQYTEILEHQAAILALLASMRARGYRTEVVGNYEDTQYFMVHPDFEYEDRFKATTPAWAVFASY